jgi:hypothetical protein
LLGPFPFVDFEIDADPIQQRSVGSADRFGAAEEPPIRSFGVLLYHPAGEAE